MGTLYLSEKGTLKTSHVMSGEDKEAATTLACMLDCSQEDFISTQAAKAERSENLWLRGTPCI